MVDAIIHDRRVRELVPRVALLRISALLIAIAWCGAAHDIPNDVTAQVFLKPDEQTLHLLVRVPLKAIRDVVFPEREGGYLDLQRTEPLLADAAVLWLSDF